MVGEFCEDFAGLARNGGERPLIGVVGEIFVRSSRFRNNFV